MSPEISSDPEYERALRHWEKQHDLVNDARKLRESATGRVSERIARLRVSLRERAEFRSDEHLGMIEAIRATSEGADPESVIRELDY